MRGLTAAHTCNVLHRDIKPGELRLGEIEAQLAELWRMAGDQIVSCA